MTVPGKLKLVKDTVPDIIRTNLTLNLDPNDQPSSSGSTLYDLTGNNPATLYNSPTHNSDIGYYDYNGTDQYLTVSEPLLTGADDFTFEIWLNIDTVAGNWSPSYTAANLFTHPVANGADLTIVSYNGQPWLLRWKRLVTLFGPNFNVYGTITNGNWYQLVLTQDNTNGGTVVYVNGVSTYTDATYQYTAWATPAGNTYLLGDHNASPPLAEFDGKVGEIRTYNSVLTAAEVTNNFNARRWRYGL